MEIRSRGTIENVGRGKWRLHISTGYDEATGKYGRASRTVTGNKSEALKEMERFRQELREGTVTTERPYAYTVGQYAADFHEERANAMGSPLSWSREAVEIKNVVVFFGGWRIDELAPADIRQTYARIRREGTLNDKGIYRLHKTLKQVMRQAVCDELIGRNPCDAVKVSRPKPAERSSLGADGAQRLYEVLVSGEPHPNKVATLLALETGMRRGEVLGLQWKNVRLAEGKLYVAKQFAADRELRDPKSESPKRWVSLNAETVEELRRWRIEQQRRFQAFNAEHAAKVSRAGLDAEAFAGVAHDGETPVISNEVCGFTDPNVFARWFRKFCVDNGFGTYGSVEEVRDTNGVKRYVRKGYEGLRFHELRHPPGHPAHIGSGADIKTVQHRLGHSSASLTMNIYAHAIKENDELAAQAIGSILTSPEEAVRVQQAADAPAGDAMDDGFLLEEIPSDEQLVRDFFRKRHREASTGEIREATGITSRKKLMRILGLLIDEGYLTRTGNTKGTMYRRA